MTKKPGPFQIIEREGSGALDEPITPPLRRYSCRHYETCLDLSAALNWDSFTCAHCNCEVDQQLLWRAHQARRRDPVAETLCDLPTIRLVVGEDTPQPILYKIAAK